MRVLIYVQTLLGIGHEMRMGALAAALSRRGHEVMYVSGGFFAPPLGVVEMVRLAPLRADGLDFKRLLDARGAVAGPEVFAERWRQLEGVLEAFEPEVVLIEGFPFARFRLAEEILGLVRRARLRGARVVCSLRDILVHLRPERRQQALERVRGHFDVVAVHADPEWVRLEASFPEALALGSAVHYTGYIGEHLRYGTRGMPGHDALPSVGAGGERGEGDEGDEVVISAGGGAMGQRLMTAALGAFRQGVCGDLRWRFMVGGQLPDGIRAELMTQQTPRLVVDEHRDDFRALLAGARLSVSQAGYNTVMDITVSGVRCVLVPFSGVDGSEDEQPARARLWHARAEAEVVPDVSCTAEALGDAMEAALGQPRARAVPDLEGSAHVGRLLEGWR